MTSQHVLDPGGRVVLDASCEEGAGSATAGCDPGPGGEIDRYLVENGCQVPIRADANDFSDVERIPDIEERPLIAPGDTARIYQSFVQAERIYVSVSREGAKETENIYPFVVAEMTPVPTEQSNIVAYTFVIEGDMCPAP